MVRKRDGHVCDGGDDSKKRPRPEPGLVTNEVRNTVSASLPQQNKVVDIVIAEGEGLQKSVQKAMNHEVACGLSKLEPLLTCEFMSSSCRGKLDKIWSILTVKNVSRFGIYGMGGVGKTEMAKCIYNNFLEDPNYSYFCWVTVSPNLSIHKLQNAIAKAMNLDLSDEEDVNIRAAKLSRNLTAKKKFVIILDDVWSYIPLQAVGIPDSLGGCKIVLTTRSLDVCRMMKCQEYVKVCCLSSGEAWELFNNELGKETTESSFGEKIEEIKKSIVERCGGLPLMIVSMARRMRTVYLPYEWSDALEEMKGSKFSRGLVDVFHKLKLSYDHLEDQSLQQCFLYCALFDNFSFFDDIYGTRFLIEHLIVEKIIDEMSSRQAKLDRGNVLLNKLQHAGLLEYKNGLHMHKLVRKMAFHIMNESSPSIVEIGEQINYQPEGQHCMRNIVRVSLTERDFTAIPSYCFQLDSSVTTWLLHHNKKLESLEGAFFDQFQRLKVLTLSGSQIVRLPNSISSLKDLRALFLRRCCKLRDIPSLAKLKFLEVLDLYDCEGVEELPEGVEFLYNLRYLNLLCSGITELRAGILTRLIHLEYLAFNWPSVAVSAKEVAALPKLEFLVWFFHDISELYAYLHECKGSLLVKYFIYIGEPDVTYSLDMDEEPMDRELFLCNCSMNRTLLMQRGIQKLTLREMSVDVGSGLCLLNAVGVNSSEIELHTLDIRYFKNMEYLFNEWSSTSVLGSIETVELGYVYELRDLFGRERDNRVPSRTIVPDDAIFSNLRKISIERCNNMKKLFPPSLLPNLKNLAWISVVKCSGMEEIIAAPEQETGDRVSYSNFNKTLQLTFPNLKSLYLRKLPKLKSICGAQMKCDSLIDITISKCEKLERIPISLPLPHLGMLEAFPESWWKSVHWGLPNQKHVLQPLFVKW